MVFNIDDIEKFNLKLQSIYQQWPSYLLGDYVNQLSEQLDAFDWEKIPQTLANFTTVITALNTQA